LEASSPANSLIEPSNALNLIFHEPTGSSIVLESPQFKSKELDSNRCPGTLIVSLKEIANARQPDCRWLKGPFSWMVVTEDWAQGMIKTVDLSTSYESLTLVGAHAASISRVKVLSGGLQNPQIEKSRSSPTVPFAIVA
jgi:hypothetical protein